MIEFKVISENRSPVRSLASIEVRIQALHFGGAGPHGEHYASARLASELEVIGWFDEVLKNLMEAKHRAIALLREND
jgi:hypothetical protein